MPDDIDQDDSDDVVVAGPWRRRDAQPYEPGNTASLKHGAWSPRLVDPLASDILAGAIGEGLPTWWAPTD